MAQPQRRPSLDSDIEEDPERGKKVRIKVFLIKLAFSSLHRLLKDTKLLSRYIVFFFINFQYFEITLNSLYPKGSSDTLLYNTL